MEVSHSYLDFNANFVLSIYSMGSKINEIDKRVSPGPSVYDIPSKIVEKQGKTFGLKAIGLKDTT